MTSRSGSSLAAKFFAESGFNAGDHIDQRCRDGSRYPTYELPEMKEWIRKNKEKINLRHGRFVDWIPGIEERIPDRSVCKTGVEFWPLFEPFARWVITVRRDPHCAFKSVMAKNPGNPLEVRKLLAWRFKQLDRIRRETGGVELDMDAIVSGDFCTLQNAFEYVGIPFNRDRLAGMIDLTQWHYRNQL